MQADHPYLPETTGIAIKRRPPAPPGTTLPAIVYQRAWTQPLAIAYRFFHGPDLAAEQLSFHDLWEQAAGIATLLCERRMQGERALVVCKSQKNFVLAFYACLLAGVIAVPTAPPRRAVLEGRLHLLAEDAQASLLICDDTLDGLAGMPRLHVEQVMQNHDIAALALEWRLPPLDGASIAFLQYTSGSTGDPKGVIVTHANLIDNCATIAEAMGMSAASSIFTALPLFHDMGLVGGILQPMFVGCSASCMAPAEFVQYPERWLQIMSRYRISTSGGPNFMYDLAAQAVTAEQLAGCDLSAWRVAFCGAEPIRAATMARFTERMAGVGFRPNAFYPCYGMAEATLFITGKRLGALPDVCRAHGSDVVGCGVPRGAMQVEIVDPHSAAMVADGAIGEIWVRGASVAQGYWQRPQLSADTFQARIAGRGGESFMRTGDLGYRRNGQLYVTGRLKDLIIIYGKKYAPQDIEEHAERAHDALRAGCGAAFGVVRDGSERLVLVFELRRAWLRREREWPQVADSIKRSVSRQHGVAIDELVFIKTGALPRTSSGKVRRAQCQRDYLSGELGSLTAPDGA